MKKEMIIKLKNHINKKGFVFNFDKYISGFNAHDAACEIVKEMGTKERDIIKEKTIIKPLGVKERDVITDILEDFIDLIIERDIENSHDVFLDEVFKEYLGFEEYLNEIAA